MDKLSIEEAVAATGLSRATLYRRIRAGDIASGTVQDGLGYRRVVPLSEVQRIIAETAKAAQSRKTA